MGPRLPVTIGGYMEADQPQLLVEDAGVGFLKRRLALPQTLHLSTQQDDSAVELFEDVKPVAGSTVAADGGVRGGCFLHKLLCDIWLRLKPPDFQCCFMLPDTDADSTMACPRCNMRVDKRL